MANMTMIQAITEALDIALEKDPNVLIFGEDVGENGGVFRATAGLQEKHGENRVFNTPLAESGIGGLAIGLTQEQYRPIMEIQFFAFVFEVLDSIAGQAGRYRYRMNSTRTMPITIRSPFGGGVHTPEMHADSLEGLIAQSPGVKVVIPSNPIDAKGLLLAAIEDEDPVVFLEHMKLYRSVRAEVPEGYYTTPIGQAVVAKAGTDITIITYGAMVNESLQVAIELEDENISVEVVDLRTISPLDIATISASVNKTGRALVVQEAQRQAGIGAMIIAEIAERDILALKAPIGRIAAPDTIFPFGMAENAWLPNKNDIKEKIFEIMKFE